MLFQKPLWLQTGLEPEQLISISGTKLQQILQICKFLRDFFVWRGRLWRMMIRKRMFLPEHIVKYGCSEGIGGDGMALTVVGEGGNRGGRREFDESSTSARQTVHNRCF